jgi:copper chaperone CopZ
VFICIFSIKSYAKKLANGCCGGGDVEKKIKVKDKNKADYPFCVEIAVDGMTCGHCKTRVENALNSESGVWAEVDLKRKSVTVRMKERRLFFLEAKRTKNLGWFAFCEAKLRIPTGFQNYFVILKLDSPRTPNGQGRCTATVHRSEVRVAPAPTRFTVWLG